jgi:HlyD family secretion protein
MMKIPRLRPIRDLGRAASLAALAMAALLLAGCGEDDHAFRAMGTLEVVEVDVAPLQPGRVQRVWVDEGDSVRPGDTLAVLAQAGVAGAVPQGAARLQQAEARLRDVQAGPRPEEVAQAEDAFRARQAEAERTARELERVRVLEDAGAMSRQQLDNARAAAAVAARQRDSAREGVRMARQGSRTDQVAAARAEVEAARAALETSRATAGELTLVSSVAGVVMHRYAEPGEMVATGEPVLTVGQTSRPYTRVYVGQGVLPTLKVGQPVTAVLDAFPERPFTGRIVSISDHAEFTPRVALTEEERDDLLFGVRVELADRGGMLKAGLPLTVTFPAPPAGGGPR